MPDGNLIVSSTDVSFSYAEMWGKGPGGGSYDIPFGVLQDGKIDLKHSLAELKDSKYRIPISVASKEASLGITAKVARIRGRMLQLCMGGVLTTTGGGSPTSLLRMHADDIVPLAFALQIKSSESPTAAVLATVYQVVSSDFSMAVKPDDFIMSDITGKCYGDPSFTPPLVMDIVLQGDHTSDGGSAPVAPTGVTATAGVAATGEIALAWTAAAGATEYRIYRSTTTGTGYLYIGSTTGTHFDNYGTSSTHYYYVVTTVNGVSESGYSTEVNATAP